MEFHKILVPVAGTKADEEAMELANRLLAKKNNGKICAVHVISIERALPLDAEIESEIRKAEDILNHIEGIAEEQGCKIETDLLQAREVAPAAVGPPPRRSPVPRRCSPVRSCRRRCRPRRVFRASTPCELPGNGRPRGANRAPGGRRRRPVAACPPGR